MAGKRSASNQLNHENWDTEETPEEAGSFQRATDDSLKRRIIKTAKRRNPISSVRDSGDGENNSAFSSFSGFGKPAPSTSKAFSFLSDLTSKTPPKTNGVEENSEKSKSDTTVFKLNSNPITNSTIQTDKGTEMLDWIKRVHHKEKITSNVFTTSLTSSNNNKDNDPSNSQSDNSSNFYSKLKGLNQSVSNWIKEHVDTNPLINLQPIFRDYDKYFAELEKERDLKPPDTNKSISSFVFKPTTNIPDSTTEKNQSDLKADNNPSKLTFGSSVTSTGSTAIPSFSFGSKPSAQLGTSASLGATKASDAPQTTNTSTSSFTFGTKSVSSPAATTQEVSKAVSSNIPSFSFGVQPASSFSFGKNVSSSAPVSIEATEAAKSTNTSVSQVPFGIPSSNLTLELIKGSPSFTSVSSPAATTQEVSKAVNSNIPSVSFGVQPASSFSFGKNVSSSAPVSIGATEAAKSTNTSVSQVPYRIPPSNLKLEIIKGPPSFTFGAKPTNTPTVSGASSDAKKMPVTSTPSFTFGTIPSNSTVSPFASSSPFAFSNVAKPVSSVETKEDDEDEEPPKNEFTPVVEKDHIYTIRCKVFIKKDNTFGDRGVGNLYLKPVAESDKVQLIVRADTNLGNILVNLILSKNIPTKRLGAKDVMLVCIPTPDVEPPPATVLLRVKSSEEADQLLEILDKHKK